MSKVKVELNRDAISTQLLKSTEIKMFMEDLAENILLKCEGDYEIEVYDGKNRSNVAIVTTDGATYGKNLKNNELLKAIGAAG